MKRKLGIIASCLKDIATVDALDKIKAAGFETIFTGEYKYEDVAPIKEKADALGLVYETIHAPFRAINDMWIPGMKYLGIYEALKTSIDSAAACGIPYVITHVSSGWNPPEVNDLGLQRYDELVLYAREKGVTLAFENLRLLGNLSYLADRYRGMKNVAFCFDCGHEHCYTKTVSMIDVFTTHICCTHIHDNHSRPLEDTVNDFDEHLLPFDGTYDYAKMMRKLDEYGYAGPLTLEVSMHRPEYLCMTHEEFLSTCYERIKKISEM